MPKTQSQNEDSAMNVDDEVPTAEVTKDKGKGKAASHDADIDMEGDGDSILQIRTERVSS